MPQLVRKNTQELDLKTYEEIDLSDINDVPSKRDINILQLSNKNFVLEYIKKNYRILEVRNFQKINRFHKRVKRPLSESSSKSFSFLRLNQNKILLYELGKEIRSFVVFDENLNVKISKQVPHGFVDIITTDSKIFALLSNRNSLIVYDWNLNELMKIFPKSNLFYFNNSILQFQENEQFIFVRSEDSLSMISKKTEEIIQKISLDKDVLINGINTFNLFVSLDKMDKLDVLDFNGQVVSSILLKNFPKNEVKFLIDVNQNIICLDPVRLKLYLPIAI
ncbi:unnamed protein product [Brachionus calyciflorus]|uniref:Uncharacterized protein n=1 Tax=Brachionus calyciflorus TaxID=104777 RepID=A0A814PU71_9BILA|nr:unnamed protein product [Brachionus calyciflorus]